MSFNPVNGSQCSKLISLVSRDRHPTGGAHSSDARSAFRLIGGHRVSASRECGDTVMVMRDAKRTLRGGVSVIFHSRIREAPELTSVFSP